MKRTHLLLFFVMSVSLAACQQTSSPVAPPVAMPPASPTPVGASTLAPTVTNELKTVASGLQYQDLVVGTGQKPGFNQTVRIAYVGKLSSGTTFDKGVDDFKLGVGDVIKGWDLGIVGGGGVEPMREGGKRKLIVPPALGYGDKIMSTIPANSTLVFEVELLRVNKPGFGR